MVSFTVSSEDTRDGNTKWYIKPKVHEMLLHDVPQDSVHKFVTYNNVDLTEIQLSDDPGFVCNNPLGGGVSEYYKIVDSSGENANFVATDVDYY